MTNEEYGQKASEAVEEIKALLPKACEEERAIPFGDVMVLAERIMAMSRRVISQKAYGYINSMQEEIPIPPNEISIGIEDGFITVLMPEFINLRSKFRQLWTEECGRAIRDFARQNPPDINKDERYYMVAARFLWKDPRSRCCNNDNMAGREILLSIAKCLGLSIEPDKIQFVYTSMWNPDLTGMHIYVASKERMPELMEYLISLEKKRNEVWETTGNENESGCTGKPESKPKSHSSTQQKRKRGHLIDS